MAFFIHFKNPNAPEMIRTLEEIPKSPGICFFIDIHKSTDLKYRDGLSNWGRKLNNTFNFLIYSNHFEKDVVKGIGDEIMLFIPDTELHKRYARGAYFTVLEDVFASIYNICHHPDSGLFLNCKVCIHYCTDVYNISFLEAANDYYGSDIDLTARLMSRCIENRIVISEHFFDKVKADLAHLNLSAKTGCLGGISDAIVESFKGVPVDTAYRFIDVV